MQNLKKKIYVGCLLMICTVCFCACSVWNGEEVVGNDFDTSNKDNLDVVIGDKEQDVYVCDAAIIKQARINYVPCVKLEEKFLEKDFMEECVTILKDVLYNNSSSFLYGKRGCYITTKEVCMFDIAEYELANIVRCFIFTEEGVEAGEMFFYIMDGTLEFNIIMKDVENGVKSDVLDILEDVPQDKLVLLTNGYRHTTLNQNNELGKLNGSVSFEIVGDCYQELNNKTLAISYADIMDRDNWVWVEFE